MPRLSPTGGGAQRGASLPPTSESDGLDEEQRRTLAFVDGTLQSVADRYRAEGNPAGVQGIANVRLRLHVSFPFLLEVPDTP